MCLGESTTANLYPRFLEAELNERGQGIPFSVIDKGIPSINTDVILAQLEANLDRYKPDLVVTMMGINDQGESMSPEIRNSSVFFRGFLSLRVVKLARSLKLHLAEKINKAKEVKSSAGKMPGPPESSTDVPREKIKNFGLANSQELLDISGSVPSEVERSFLRNAWKALSDGENGRAERLFREVLARNPRNAQAYYGLAWIPRAAYTFNHQETLLLKVIELKPEEAVGYSSLGDLYLSEKKYEQAERAYKKAERLHHEKGHIEQMENVVFSRVYIYLIQKRYADAEQALKQYLAINPKSDRCCRRLILFYYETGRSREAADYEKKEKLLDVDFYNAFTVANYHRLKAVLDRRKIPLVCAQYPMRNIAVLKEIFAFQEGVFFVDNEKVFKSAVANGHFHEYFRDMFGGDFGHCTDLGNKLLAKQIANVILREVLGVR